MKATLAGAGGRGAGFVAAALGGAPRASFDGARLADGRLLLRELQVTGAGLKLEATGGRGLLGGLTFKGKAGGLQPGGGAGRRGGRGAGELVGGAGQGRPALDLHPRRPRRPVRHRLSRARPAAGRQAAAEGRRPTCRAAGWRSARRASTARRCRPRTAGVLAADGGLTFKLDWSADGPVPRRAGGDRRQGQGLGRDHRHARTRRAPTCWPTSTQIDVPRLPLKDAHLTLSFLRKPDGSSGMVGADRRQRLRPGPRPLGLPLPGGRRRPDRPVGGRGRGEGARARCRCAAARRRPPTWRWR